MNRGRAEACHFRRYQSPVSYPRGVVQYPIEYTSLKFKGEVHHIFVTLFTVTGMMPSRPRLRPSELQRSGRERRTSKGDGEGAARETGGRPRVMFSRSPSEQGVS